MIRNTKVYSKLINIILSIYGSQQKLKLNICTTGTENELRTVYDGFAEEVFISASIIMSVLTKTFRQRTIEHFHDDLYPTPLK